MQKCIKPILQMSKRAFEGEQQRPKWINWRKGESSLRMHGVK